MTKLIVNKMAKAKENNPEEPDFLQEMDTSEINQLLTALVPVLKLEGGKYLLGTQKHIVQIKSNCLMIRVGGGFATMTEYLHQNGPFECIKLTKVMRDQKCNFKDAVKFYLEKHNAAKKVMSEWIKTKDNNTELFEKTIQRMRDL